MRSNYHARRRIKERLGNVPLDVIVKQVKQTHGYPTHFRSELKKHVITVNGQRVKAIYDWKRHRLMTIIPLGQEANDD